MEILKLHINIKGSNSVKSPSAQVNMVMFDGWCEGVFNGKILDGGVDTQILPANGKGTLSARYMLEGKDSSDNNCSMFIENNGLFTDDGIITTPKIYTDSETLKYLETADLYGTVTGTENGVLISIFKNN